MSNNKPINTEEAKKNSSNELFEKLSTGKTGLSSSEVEKRLIQYGPNEISEKKVNPLLKFLGYFWGPIPWMIEAAVFMSAIIGHWDDFGIILSLLLLNATVGFWRYCNPAIGGYTDHCIWSFVACNGLGFSPFRLGICFASLSHN